MCRNRNEKYKWEQWRNQYSLQSAVWPWTKNSIRQHFITSWPAGFMRCAYIIQLCYFEFAPQTRDTTLLEYADHQLIVWLIAHSVKKSIKQSTGGRHILTNWCPSRSAVDCLIDCPFRQKINQTINWWSAYPNKLVSRVWGVNSK